MIVAILKNGALASCSLAPSWSPSLPIPFPLSPRGHGQPLLLYSLLLSAFLCLCYPLNSPPRALNKLYSILYCRMAGPSQGRDALAWAHRSTSSPHTLPEHILIALSLFMITTGRSAESCPWGWSLWWSTWLGFHLGDMSGLVCEDDSREC